MNAGFTSIRKALLRKCAAMLRESFTTQGIVSGTLRVAIDASLAPNPAEWKDFKKDLLRDLNIDLGSAWSSRFLINDPIQVGARGVLDFQQMMGPVSRDAEAEFETKGFWAGINESAIPVGRVDLEVADLVPQFVGSLIVTRIKQEPVVDAGGTIVPREVEVDSWIFGEGHWPIGRNKAGRFATKNAIPLQSPDISNNQALVFSNEEGWMIGYGAIKDSRMGQGIARPTLYIVRGSAVITVYHTERLEDGDRVAFGRDIPESLRFEVIPTAVLADGGMQVEIAGSRPSGDPRTDWNAIDQVREKLICVLVQGENQPELEVDIAPDGRIRVPESKVPGAVLELRARKHPAFVLDRAALECPTPECCSK